MSNPQQPELARSRKTPALAPDAVAGQPSGTPATTEPTGPVPAENQPGHHPDQEQDRPDLGAFAARLGVAPGTDPAPAAGPAPSEPVAAPGTAPRTAAATTAGAPARAARPAACQLVDLALSSVRVPLAVLRAVRRRLG